MKVLNAEKEIGIETFFTPFKGTGGTLRNHPEDFIVNEISCFPKQSEKGRFLITNVTSKNWETNLLIREMADRLRVSRQRIGFAGTKDKRALTSQMMSFCNITPEEISKIKIKDVSIEPLFRSDKSASLGDLVGNRFEIIVRKIIDDMREEDVSKIVNYIINYGGFPNYFGVQRFGVIRPITNIVGKFIVEDDFENAVMTYIAHPMKGEDNETFKLREALQKTRDYKDAFNTYPNKLSFEKAILNKLINNPNDFVGALKELPKNLLTMFVYAYQSYLFNKILSERIKKKLPLNKAIEGDITLPLRKGKLEEKGIKVTENNLEKVNFQISKGKAVVSGALFGSESVFSTGEIGEIEHKILKKEKLDPRDFIIPDMPQVSSRGTRRPLLAFLKDLNFKIIDDDINVGKKALSLKFELQKGSYATSILREIIKADDIRNY